MNIAVLKVKVVALQDIRKEASYYAIAKLIDKVMCADDKYQAMHTSKDYKPYNFSGLSKPEADGIYRKDRVYSFTIRTIDFELAKYLESSIKRFETEYLKPYGLELWVVHQKLITKLYSLTPMLIKREGGYLRNHSSIKEIEKFLFENLIKKYKFFTKTEMEDEDFNIWNAFVFLNEKPIKVEYKNGIMLLGDKVEMSIDTNKRAQDIAHMALGVGIGENCSRGCGYVNYHIIR